MDWKIRLTDAELAEHETLRTECDRLRARVAEHDEFMRVYIRTTTTIMFLSFLFWLLDMLPTTPLARDRCGGYHY